MAFVAAFVVVFTFEEKNISILVTVRSISTEIFVTVFVTVSMTVFVFGRYFTKYPNLNSAPHKLYSQEALPV